MAAAQPKTVDINQGDGADKRRHRRVPLTLRARFLAPDGAEHECQVVNISAGGLRLVAKHHLSREEKLVLYVEHVGRFDCMVVRNCADGFAVRFDIHAKKRERTVEALSKLLLSGPRGAEQRRELRVESDTSASLTLETGETLPCRISDISLTGAAIEVDRKLEIGSIVRLGRMTAKVVRRNETGYGLAFAEKNASDGLAGVMRSVNTAG